MDEKESVVQDGLENLVANLGLTRALATVIVDKFDSLLERHNIVVPDEDRTGSEDEACLYGCTYYNLVDEVYALLCDYIDE